MKRLSLIFAAIGLAFGAQAQVIYNGLDPAGANTSNGYFSTDGGIAQYASNFGGETGQLIYDTVGASSITTVEAQFLGGSPASYTGGSSEMLLQLFAVVNGVVSNSPISGDSKLFSLGNGIDGQTFSEVDWTLTQGPASGFYYWNDAIGGLNWAINPGSTYLISMQNVGPNVGYTGINNGTFTGTGNNGSNTNAYVRDYSNYGNPGVWGVTSWTEASADGYNSGNYNMLVVGSPAPEPASLCALGIGLAALLRRRRMR